MAARETLVVKVGTSTLLGTHERPSETFGYVAKSIRLLRERYDIVLVTSGAIGFGVRQLNLATRPEELHQLQALSMIGQVGLLGKWRDAFDNVTIGQALVTRHDLEKQTTSTLLKESVKSLWEYGALPIVNENDAVAFEEISFGDNDRLAAEVAVALNATTLVLLTDQDGIQAEFGSEHQKRLALVAIGEIDTHIRATKSYMGKGGASSKVQAAKVALDAGVQVFIAHAGHEESLESVLAGKVGTKIVQ